MDFDPPVQVVCTENGLARSFAHSDDLLAWLDAQEQAWNSVPKPQHRRLVQIRGQQDRSFADLRESIESLDRNRIEAALIDLREGRSISTESRFFPSIASAGEASPDSAGYLLVMVRSDGAALLNNMGIGQPLDGILRAFCHALPQSVAAVKIAQGTLEDGFSQTKASYEAALNSARSSNRELQEKLGSAGEAFEKDRGARSDEWADHMKDSREEWAKLKLTYDTELGLRAPTTYWSDRGRSQRNVAIAYGAAFSVALAAAISVFAFLGVDYLVRLPNDKNAILGLLPILIPAFAAVWILRILGRLLAESMNLMRDARERETLVKTFLALMKDDSTGKSVVKDEDRILILHSLFRPASTGAVDDSPPVHWFDVLASRMGTKK